MPDMMACMPSGYRSGSAFDALEDKPGPTAPTAVRGSSSRLRVAASSETMRHLATTAVEIRRGTGTTDIEAVRRGGRETVEPTHDRLPLVSVRARQKPAFQMKYQPVGHFVGHDLIHEGLTILIQKDPVETQASPLIMRLAGAATPQVEPDLGIRQSGMHLASQAPGRLDLAQETLFERVGGKRGQCAGIGDAKRRGQERRSQIGHGMLECRHQPRASSPPTRAPEPCMTTDQEDAIESHPPLDDEALTRLDDYLDSGRVGEEVPDVIGAHGYLVALAVSPGDISPSQWIAEFFEGEPAFDTPAERNDILGLFEALKANAGYILERGQWVELPFDTELDDDGETAAAIEDWCAGFMQGVFLDESAWFAQDEAHVAALLLPFMALSGLFDDQPEMAEMVADDDQFIALARQLPELTLDLYLHFRVPPETPKPKSGPGRSESKSARRRGKR